MNTEHRSFAQNTSIGEMPGLLPREPGKPWCLDDAAEFLGVHLHTLRRAIERGKIKTIHFGRRVMLADSEVRRVASSGF